MNQNLICLFFIYFLSLFSFGQGIRPGLYVMVPAQETQATILVKTQQKGAAWSIVSVKRGTEYFTLEADKPESWRIQKGGVQRGKMTGKAFALRTGTGHLSAALLTY